MLTYAGIRTVLVKDGIIPKLVKLLKKAQFRHVALTLVKALSHHYFTHFTTRFIYIRHVALTLVKVLSHYFTHFTTRCSAALLYSLYY